MSLPLLDPTLEEVAAPAPSQRTVPQSFLWTWGVILPLAAIGFRAGTGILSNWEFDPMPNLWFLAVLLAVPACHATAWWGLGRQRGARLFAGMTGFSCAIAGFYSLLLLPLLPFALLALIGLLGILGFAPVFSLWTSIRLLLAWRRVTGPRPIWWGAASGVAALVLLGLPALAVRTSPGMVASGHEWVRDATFAILRTDFGRKELRRGVQEEHGVMARDWLALLTGHTMLSSQESGRLFYSATGTTAEREETAPRATPVVLANSSLKGKVDGAAATSYFEWTFVFHNNSSRAEEARMELALPTGGVVSRATLWVNGRESEAAFGGEGQVREAYQSVVHAKRDPLLVTTSGPDRVQVRCFPVQPQGEMKIRIGVTSPVVPEGLSDAGLVALPALLNRNFQATEPAWVWVESESPIAPFAPAWVGNGHAVHGPLRADTRAALRVSGLTWTPVRAAAAGVVVEQRFVDREVARPERVIVVIDGSESMRAFQKEIAAAVTSIPPEIPVKVLVAERSGVARWRPSMGWEGGVDPVPALRRALADAGSGMVLWIAGEQPLRSVAMDELANTLRRGDGRLAILAGDGPNLIARQLEGLPNVEVVTRLGGVAQDLRRYTARWRGEGRQRVAERRVVDALAEGSPDVVRLWASNEVVRLAAMDGEKALALAVSQRIVTPVSGAVVLESTAQYLQNGLTPPSSADGTIAPEPGTWGLLTIGAAMFGAMAWRKRRAGLPSA